MWIPIEGYKWPYRINEEGVVQKFYKEKWTALHPFLNSTRARVSMRKKDGKKELVPVVWLMADAFMGGRKPGVCIVHKNGAKLDNRLSNLKIESQKNTGLMSASCRRKAVEKIDRYGNVIELYKSQRDAAAKNHISKSSVSARCCGKVKDPFLLTGYSFRHEKPLPK